MPRSLSLSLPSRAVPVMQWLAGLPEQEFLALLDSISDSEAAQSRTQLGDCFQRAVPDAPDSRGIELVRELFSLLDSHFTHGWSNEEIAAHVSSRKSLSLSDEEQDILRRRLVALASNPLIMRLAKAWDLYGEYGNLLHYARILNDIRPITDDSADQTVIGAIIAHILKLEYHSAEGREEIYIALDDGDLEELGNAVERAKRESKSLEEFIKSAGLTDLSQSAE